MLSSLAPMKAITSPKVCILFLLLNSEDNFSLPSTKLRSDWSRMGYVLKGSSCLTKAAATLVDSSIDTDFPVVKIPIDAVMGDLQV